jgi:cobalt/nickel transport system permease protein
VHALDARVKFVLLLAFILTNALLPVGAWPAYLLTFALVLAVEILSELGVGYVLKRSILALPFILAAFPLLFTLQGPVLFTLSLGSWKAPLYQPGLERFLSIAFKSWISLQAAIVFAASTAFPDILLAMRAVRLPRLLVAVFGLMWRYLFVLVDEVLRLMRARAARSGHSAGHQPGGGLAWRARVAGGMAGNLFLRGFDRSDRIYMAMVSRGYDGEVRSLSHPALRLAHWIILVFGFILFGSLLALAILFWG